MNEFHDYGFVPWWCLKATFEKGEMLRQLQLMKDVGIDEFFIYPDIALVEPDYLSDEWFEAVGFIIQEAKKRQMHVWIYDELNWPSGTAGGLCPRNFPQYRMKNLVQESYTLLPGDFYPNSTCNECIRVFVRPQDAPQASWQMVQMQDNVFVNETNQTLLFKAFHIILTMDRNMSSMAARSTWNQRGICDRLNPDAIRAWISCTHDKYYEHFHDECGKTLRGFFYDEPSVISEFGNLPWTDGLDVDFQNQYGYNFLDHLPEFYEDIPGAEKVRNDFWSLIGKRFALSFNKTLTDWCTAHNLLLTGHSNIEELIAQSGRLFYSVNIPLLQSFQQIPAMDLLGDHTPFHLGMAPNRKYADEIAHNYLFTAKQVTSTARYTGAKRVMAEATGICDRNLAPRRTKIAWDWLSGAGVSMFNLNGLGYSEKGFVKRSGGLYSFFQPWFRQFGILSSFVRETSKFATGRLVTDVAVFDPETTIRSLTYITTSGDFRIDPKAFVAPAVIGAMTALMFSHINHELLFEEVLLKSEVSDGVIHAPNSAFRALILPKAEVLTEELAAKIRAFRQGGGQIFCIEKRPVRTPDGKPLDFSDLPLVEAEELPALLKDCLSLPYSITGTGEVFSALRDCEGIPTLFLANMGKDSADFQVETNSLPTPVVAKLTGDDPWQLQGNSIHLEPFQSLFLRFGQTVPNPQPPVTWGAKKSANRVLQGPWDYTISRPNNAIPTFELGMAPNEAEKSDIGNVRCWLPCSWDGCYNVEFTPQECPHYWLRSQFDIEDASVIPGLSLVYEEESMLRLRVNGMELPLPNDRYPLWTFENRKIDISHVVRPGRNTLEILCPTSYWNAEEKKSMFAMNFIEPFVLHGDFATATGDKIVRLFPRPKQLHLGDVGKQGFPWLLGDINYRIVLHGDQASTVELPDIGDASVDATLNGEFLGSRLWNPFRFDLKGKLLPGENELLVSIPTSLGNFIPRAFAYRRVPLSKIGIMNPLELS